MYKILAIFCTILLVVPQTVKCRADGTGEHILQRCGQCGNYWVEFECKTTETRDSMKCSDTISFFCQNGTTGINYGNGLSVIGPDVSNHDESDGFDNASLCVPEIVSSN